MKTRLIIATILILLGAIIHTVGGELTDIKALLTSNIASNLKLEMRIVWYMIAIDFIYSAAYLIYIIFKNKMNDYKNLIEFIGIRMMLYGIVFFIVILSTNPTFLVQLPQWILLLTIGLLLEWDLIKKLWFAA